MDRNEPYRIASKQLLHAEESGFKEISKLTGTHEEKKIVGEDNNQYDVEMLYSWLNDDKLKIRVT